MGTLRSEQWTEIDGKRVSPCTGHTYNGVILGEALEVDGNPGTVEWDDSAYPNGTCEVVEGALVVTPDPMDVI